MQIIRFVQESKRHILVFINNFSSYKHLLLCCKRYAIHKTYFVYTAHTRTLQGCQHTNALCISQTVGHVPCSLNHPHKKTQQKTLSNCLQNNTIINSVNLINKTVNMIFQRNFMHRIQTNIPQLCKLSEMNHFLVAENQFGSLAKFDLLCFPLRCEVHTFLQFSETFGMGQRERQDKRMKRDGC